MHARLPFVVSAVFHYLGPAFAVLLFVRVDVLGVAWLRIAAAALVFALWRRPWHAAARPRRARLGRRAGADELLLLPRDRPAAAGDGGRDRVPAGDRARRARRAHAPQRARRSRWPSRASTCSPACTSRASRSASRWPSPTRALFAAYIVLAHRVASIRDAGIDGLAAAMIDRAGRSSRRWRAGRRVPAFARPGGARGRASASASRRSVIPYVADQVAMARLTRAGLRADGLAAAGDGDRDRPDRAHAGAVGDRRGSGSRSSSRGWRSIASPHLRQPHHRRRRRGHLLQRRPLPRRVVVMAAREQVRRRQAHRAQA